MLIKITKDMTDSERIAAENTNNSYLNNLCAEAQTLFENTADYILESGDVEVDGTTWIYEKLNSGIAKLWCKVTVTYTNISVLQKTGIYFPFEFTAEPIGITTINEYSNSTSDLHKNSKIFCKTDRCTVSVHNASNSFTSGSTIDVAVFVIGQWK